LAAPLGAENIEKAQSPENPEEKADCVGRPEERQHRCQSELFSLLFSSVELAHLGEIPNQLMPLSAPPNRGLSEDALAGAAHDSGA